MPSLVKLVIDGATITQRVLHLWVLNAKCAAESAFCIWMEQYWVIVFYIAVALPQDGRNGWPKHGAVNVMCCWPCISVHSQQLTNSMHKFPFHNKFIICLYMFRALCAHHQEVNIVLYSIWYRHTCWRPSGARVETGPLSTCAREGHLQVWRYQMLLTSWWWAQSARNL